MALTWKVDYGTGNVYTSTDGGTTYTQIANVLDFLVAQKYRTASNDWQGDILVRVHDTAADTVVVNQAPAVLTAVTRQAMAGVPAEKRERSRNGDVIKLYNGATLIATINAAGSSFGTEGDAVLYGERSV